MDGDTGISACDIGNPYRETEPLYGDTETPHRETGRLPDDTRYPYHHERLLARETLFLDRLLGFLQSEPIF